MKNALFELLKDIDHRLPTLARAVEQAYGAIAGDRDVAAAATEVRVALRDVAILHPQLESLINTTKEQV